MLWRTQYETLCPRSAWRNETFLRSCLLEHCSFSKTSLSHDFWHRFVGFSGRPRPRRQTKATQAEWRTPTKARGVQSASLEGVPTGITSGLRQAARFKDQSARGFRGLERHPYKRRQTRCVRYLRTEQIRKYGGRSFPTDSAPLQFL